MSKKMSMTLSYVIVFGTAICLICAIKLSNESATFGWLCALLANLQICLAKKDTYKEEENKVK